MSIRFIYGRSGSGKSHYCLSRIKDEIYSGNNRNLILIVPEQFSFQAEKNLIKTVGERGMLKAQVLSFRRMAEIVLDEVGGGTRKSINDAGRSVLLYKIIEENRDKLKVFGKTAQKRGFINFISDTIIELKRYRISPMLLKDSVDKVESVNLKNKLEDIAIIFSQFENILHKKYLDLEDTVNMLSEKLDKSKMFDDAEIWVDEFSSFTPQEYEVLKKIMCKCHKINVTLCMEGGERESATESMDLFLPVRITEKKLLEIARDNNISYDKPIILKCTPCYRFKNSQELQHLQSYLFSYPYRMYDRPVKDIEIHKALNKYTEVEHAARDIVKACRDQGLRFRDIAVVTGDMDGYESLIKAVFNEYDIPYFIDEKREIVNNPIIVLIISAVGILSKNWSYESVFRYLKTGILNLEFSEIDMLENYVLANGIRGKRWLQAEPWDFGVDYGISGKQISEEEVEYLNKINSIRDKVRAPIIKLSTAVKGKKKGNQICQGLYDFLCELKIPEKIKEIIEKFKDGSKLDRANEYGQIWSIVVDVLDQIVDSRGNETFGMEAFNEMLTNSFSQYKIGVIPPSLDQVLVSSAARVRSHDIRALYIVGVNDGIFPAPIAAEGVFTDEDRNLLREKGLELKENTKNRALQEQFLVYITLTSVDKYLKLSYSMSDGEGKTKRPSIIISMIKKIFPKLKEKSSILDAQGNEEDIESVNSPKATFNELILNLRKNIGDNGCINPIWLQVYRWYRDHDLWKERLSSVINGFYYNNEVEILDTSKVRKLYGKHLTVSVSRLEKYAQCPFAYFIQYGLKVKDRKMYNLSPPDLGSFMHEMLQKFSIYLKKKNLTWKDIDRKWCEENLNYMVDENLKSMPGFILNSSKRYRHITDRIKRILVRSLWLITEHMKRGKFEPMAYELSFGYNEDLPPISIKLHSGEEVSLVGRVDRVDEMKEEKSTYLRIIDYKSGTREFKLSDIYYGFQMQLLIYMDAILTELNERIDADAIPAGILYFKLDDPIIKSPGNISDDEIEKRIVKSLKMNGLLLNDPDLVKKMDGNMVKYSDIIPASVKKDGSLSELRSSLATMDQFQLLRKYVRNTIENICEKMLEGSIEITPYKDKNRSACTYCIYSAICQFDTSIKGNRYKIVRDKSDEEVWKDIEKGINK
ncbi:helicase-exonuclease AddAB subunit AddB [Clostridium luticellarii]|jgi:ATP-dependent helicase/nuclease subunit B|uniref:helicase-exonuclease AddAB subunit AddB n=1 Tax=Clostridium luticellarii TaxID=1691940 RepID=UPI00235573EE|nr:helicase-exonuclease AddAB subunit AddB [Clostridium luticellarii]MCI1945043.1 helicase-exonuclease AddAB subunit AddB [Clostridium luticellarii]MCI1967558.1 helicase-exonuclease AddAB subunit AddB [Clostridium luticellarii]